MTMRRKKKKVSSKDEIFEENAKESNSIPPTQVEEKQIATTIQEEIIPHPKHSSPSPKQHDVHHSGNPTTKDQEPTPEPHKKKQKVGSKNRKERKRHKEEKASVSAPPSPPKKPPGDDNEKEDPSQGERHFQDEVFENKNRKIPPTPTQHAAQVEGKQSIYRHELVNPPVQTPSPLRFDFDDISEIPSAKNDNPSSKSPGLGGSEKRRVGTAEDNGERASGRIGSRVFTEEDEITMLQGMIDCGSSHNVSASSISISVLHEFLGGKLHSDFNKTQIYEKIRRLKQKFVKNMDMYETTGEGPLKPHEAVVFQLSKKIWGGNGVDNLKSNKHVQNQSVEDNGTDVKSKKKSSRGEKNVVGESQIKVGGVVAAADDGTKDREGQDDDGEAKVKTGHDGEMKNEEDHKDIMKNRLLEEFENVMKKCRLRLELAKLELDELKKG